MWCSTLGVVAEVLRSRCVVLCTVCKFVSYTQCTILHTDSSGPQPQQLVLNTKCSNSQPMYSWRWAYRYPKHVELFKIINKFVHQVGSSRHFHIWCTDTHTSNLHKVQVTLLKPSTVANWRWSTTCGSRYGPQTSPSVTALNTSFDATGHLWSALTTHHTASNQPHILQKLDANVVVTKQEYYKQLIWNTIGAQRRTSMCRRRNAWFCSNTLLVCGNYRRYACIRRCSLKFSFLVINKTHHSDNTTQQSVENFRRYSCAGAKISFFLGGGLWWRKIIIIIIIINSFWSIGAPQSRDRNATHDRRKELTPIIRMESQRFLL
jgi:hypothetical protein